MEGKLNSTHSNALIKYPIVQFIFISTSMYVRVTILALNFNNISLLSLH